MKNLFIVDGSVFVTSGGCNPTSTIQAIALYVADQMKRRLANLSRKLKGGDKDALDQDRLLRQALAALNEGRPARTVAVASWAIADSSARILLEMKAPRLILLLDEVVTRRSETSSARKALARLADVDGVEVHYKRARRANAKRFIECMHGFGANASSWTTSDTMRRASEALPSREPKAKKAKKIKAYSADFYAYLKNCEFADNF